MVPALGTIGQGNGDSLPDGETEVVKNNAGRPRCWASMHGSMGPVRDEDGRAAAVAQVTVCSWQPGFQ